MYRTPLNRSAVVVQWYPPLPNARTATAESRVGSNPREAFYSSAGTQSVFPLWALPCSRVAAAPSQQRGNTHTPAPALLQPPRSNVGTQTPLLPRCCSPLAATWEHTPPAPALLQPPSQQRGSSSNVVGNNNMGAGARFLRNF